MVSWGQNASPTKSYPVTNSTSCFDMEGVTIGADGKVHYSVAVEVADPKGKMLFKQEPKNLKTAGLARRQTHSGVRPSQRRPPIAARRLHRKRHGRRSAHQAQPGVEWHGRGVAEGFRHRPR